MRMILAMFAVLSLPTGICVLLLAGCLFSEEGKRRVAIALYFLGAGLVLVPGIIAYLELL